MDKDDKIYLAGHSGLVGSNLLKRLEKDGYNNIITKSSTQLDLRNTKKVQEFFKNEQPDLVFLVAAKVGGIHANMTYPAEFLYDNLQIQNNVMHYSYLNNVKKLLFVSSSCVYPRETSQPMKETQILTGKFEPTNEPYAIAKIAGMKMCESYHKQYNCNFISPIPSNLYGPKDNFHPKNSHVLAALLRKFHIGKINNASNVELWGTGSAFREFLFIEDLVDALFFLMDHYNKPTPINVGSGKEIKISSLANLIKEIVGYDGEIIYDTSKPDGMPRKLMDIEKIKNLGWNAKTNLKEGIQITYSWLLDNEENIIMN